MWKLRQIHGYDLKDNDEESLDDDIYNVGLSEDEVLNELDYPDYVIYAEKGSPSMILNNDVSKKHIIENLDICNKKINNLSANNFKKSKNKIAL